MVNLFFSEYAEGSSNNKYFEIYNPTLNSIDLSNYQVERYSNGATNSSAGGITFLSGILASGDVFVLTNGDTDTTGQFGFIDMNLYNLGDYAEPNGSYPTPMHMNGNDAMVLTKNGLILDVIGRVGNKLIILDAKSGSSKFFHRYQVSLYAAMASLQLGLEIGGMYLSYHNPDIDDQNFSV